MDSSAVEAFDERPKLSASTLVSIAWFFSWRLFLMDLVLNRYTGRLLSTAFRELTGSVWVGTTLTFVVIGILSVGYLYLFRRFLAVLARTRFGDKHVELIRQQTGDNLSLKEVISVWWLLYWRCWLGSVIIGAVYGFFYPGKPLPALLDIVIFMQPYLFGMLWAVSILLRKKFVGFSLSVSDESRQIGTAYSTS